MNPARRLWVYSVVVAVTLSGMPRGAMAAGREVSCESHGMRHNYCSTGRHGDVKLLDNSGLWGCREGDTWGTETEGIWVDKGCKGRFWVDDERSGHDRGAATAAVAVLGIGLLAALAASHHKHDDASGDAVPSWMVGSFHGYNPRYRAEVTLQVGSSGRVSGTSRSGSATGAWQAGDEIRWDDGKRFKVSRTDQGFRLTQVDDDRNVIDYYRD